MMSSVIWLILPVLIMAGVFSDTHQVILGFLLVVTGASGLAVSLVQLFRKGEKVKGRMGKQLLSILALSFLMVGPAWAFSAADYSGRYACAVTSNDAVISTAPEYFTGIMKLNPNGAGGYTGTGVLKGAASAIAGVSFDDSLPPAANFCLYTLNNAASSYTVGSGGGANEVLSWTTVPSNNASCSPSFVMSDVFQVGASGKNPITSNNLFGTSAAGQGFCKKAPAVSFSDASYAARHVCSGGNDFNSLTATMKLTPDGAGHYLQGSVNSAIDGFGLPDANAFCNYSLDVTNSSYVINPNGTGFETLAWVGSPSNDAVRCPNPQFTDQTAIVLANNGGVEYSSANFLNENLAGGGECTP